METRGRCGRSTAPHHGRAHVCSPSVRAPWWEGTDPPGPPPSQHRLTPRLLLAAHLAVTRPPSPHLRPHLACLPPGPPHLVGPGTSRAGGTWQPGGQIRLAGDSLDSNRGGCTHSSDKPLTTMEPQLPVTWASRKPLASPEM